VSPAGGGEVFEDFGAVGQMHERAADVVLLEIPVAEIDEARVLFAVGPAEGFEFPRGAFEARVVAVVGREEERCAGTADGGEICERETTVGAAGNLHQAVEHEEGAVERFVTY